MHKNFCRKVSQWKIGWKKRMLTFPFVFPSRRNKHLRCKWRNVQRKQSARKWFYRWTDKYFLKFKWLITISDEKLYCESCFQFGALHKTQNLELSRGWIRNDQGFNEEYFTRHELQRIIFHKTSSLFSSGFFKDDQRRIWTKRNELQSLLSGSAVTCDVLTRYQQVQLNQFSAIYFVHPLLFEINSRNGLEAVHNDLLPTGLNLDKLTFLF